MNPVVFILSFSLIAFLISGCRQPSKHKVTKVKPFLSLVNSHQNYQEILAQLINELNVSVDKEALLVKKLDTIINRKLRRKIFFPLFQQLNNSLRKVMIEQYSRFRPLDLPEHFQAFLMAYDGAHFAELLKLYLESNNPEGLDAIEQRLHLLALKEGDKFMISHARVLFRLGRLGEAFHKVESSVKEIRLNASQRNLDPFTKFADLKKFSEDQRRDILELCEMSGSIALLQGNGVLASQRLALLFHHPEFRGIVLNDLVSAFLQENSLNKALEVLQMASLEDFEDPEIHLLRSKVLLYANHHRAAKKHWLIARSMGASGVLYEEVSFLISHYYDREVSQGEQGMFANLLDYQPSEEVLLNLDFYHMRLFVLQYEKLQRHNPKILDVLRRRYLQLSFLNRG